MSRIERRINVRGYELDASGRVSPATLLRYFEHLRWEAIAERPEYGALFAEGNFSVVVAAQLEVAREVGLGAELEGAVWLGRMGRTSVDLQHQLALAGGELVGRAMTTVVHLDGTGRPRRLPEALRSVPSDAAHAMRGPTIEGALPETAARSRHRVRASELDAFRHVNHANYVDYCEDHRAQMLADGACGDRLSAAEGRVHWLSIEYRRQAVAGDELEIASFVIPGAEAGLGFEVRRTGEAEPLCRATALYR